MRLAIVTGICVERDAISAAVVEQAATVLEIEGIDSVDVFAQHFGRPLSCPSHTVHDPWELLTHEAFGRADLAIFHFGIRYSIFDAISGVDPANTKIAVHFHNITPIDMVAPEDRPIVEHSLRQIVSPQVAGARYWYYSEFNRRTLLGWGIDETKMDFVPFPVEPPFPLHPVGGGPTLELLSVGRLVPAKGTHVIIEAVAKAREIIDRPVHLRLLGNPEFSTDEYITRLDELIDEHQMSDQVTIIDDADDAEMWHCYEVADGVISASLHEGLCVPVIEGYLAECRAIGTTAGNLPFVVQPPDEVVAPDDPDALAQAIVRLDSRVRDGAGFDHPDAEMLAHRYSRETSAEIMRQVISEALDRG